MTDENQQPEVNGSAEETEEQPSFTRKHPLERRWTLWYDSQKKDKNSWAESLCAVCTVTTIEEFWWYAFYLGRKQYTCRAHISWYWPAPLRGLFARYQTNSSIVKEIGLYRRYYLEVDLYALFFILRRTNSYPLFQFYIHCSSTPVFAAVQSSHGFRDGTRSFLLKVALRRFCTIRLHYALCCYDRFRKI
jgi:hypothetical protein